MIDAGDYYNFSAVIWTENIQGVLGVKAQFSNFSGEVWTGLN